MNHEKILTKILGKHSTQDHKKGCRDLHLRRLFSIQFLLPSSSFRVFKVPTVTTIKDFRVVNMTKLCQKSFTVS